MPEKFKYDVFLSHSAKDKPAVRQLAERLKSYGIRVWFDEWEIKPGDSIPAKIEDGLENARVLILAMSQNAFAGEWVTLERHTALFRDPDNSERRFIPLLLEDCEIKPMLRQLLYVDWRNRNESQYQQLLSTISEDEIKDAEMLREWHYACPKCFEAVGTPRAVRLRLDKGFKDIGCSVCETRVTLWDSIEEMFASEEMKAHVRRLDEKSRLATDNESKEMLLEAHARYVAAEAGQIYRGYTNSDWGIDGEIEFKVYEETVDEDGKVKVEVKASGKKVYLQLKSGDSYLRARKQGEKEIFDVKPRHAEYWLAHNYDVMLVIRTSDGETRWMNATEYLRKHGKETRQIVFDGEPFVWQSVIRLRDKLIPMPVELRQ